MVQEVANYFNKLADNYHSKALLQQEIANRLLDRLSCIKLNPKVIVDIGCSSGFSASKLATLYPKAQVYGIDISYNMLRQAKHPKVQLICADGNSMPLNIGSVDLLIANLTFNWFEDPKLYDSLHSLLAKNGVMLFSIFGRDSLQELRNLNLEVPRFLDMHIVGDMLLECGFRDPVADMEKIIVKYSSIDSLCSDLNSTGLHQSTIKVKQNDLTMLKELQLTLEVIYAYAISYGRRRIAVDTVS